MEPLPRRARLVTMGAWLFTVALLAWSLIYNVWIAS